MNLMRDIWLSKPFYGYRKITCELRIKYNLQVNSKRVLRLMQQMDIQALYPKPHTSAKAKNAGVYPYLLKDLTIHCVNQAWMVDISVPQQALWKMKVGPSQSIYRNWLQTTVSGCSQKLRS